MRRMNKPKINSNHEFELDLAPLLSVMVKLVPVMLLSSAFVQVMMIESDLPQAVKEAMVQPEDKKPKAAVQIAADAKTGIKVIVSYQGNQTTEAVPMVNGHYDYQNLHKILVKVKTQYPDTFRVELAPEGNVSYKDVVKMMDEARRSRDRNVKFPIFNEKENKTTMTDYMFPDIVFSNMMDG